jgi:glycosyltransferase involved in cell wall biosynthesis
LRELLRLGATLSPITRWNGREQQHIDWVSKGFDTATASALRRDDTAVYCYEDSAQTTFERATDLGVKRIYELPILHYREMDRIFRVETARHPELKRFFETLREPEWKLERKDRELMTADIIVVAAEFVRKSIERYLKPTAQIIVVPYGADVQTEPRAWSAANNTGPLRLFYAGILGPRKGIHVLLEALAGIPAAEYVLTLAGRWAPGYQEWLSKRYATKYTYIGQVRHSQVYANCKEAHLFVFPSLAEGYGLVILEAMACGVPVLTTQQTAGPEIITEGIDGWIVPAGEVEPLRARIAEIIEHRCVLPEMGVAARKTAERQNWAKYRSELRAQITASLHRPRLNEGHP